jgi:hypothetical protein
LDSLAGLLGFTGLQDLPSDLKSRVESSLQAEPERESHWTQVAPGPYPQAYQILKVKNPLLAVELGKLPEFQDGVSDSAAQLIEALNSKVEGYHWIEFDAVVDRLNAPELIELISSWDWPGLPVQKNFSTSG